MPITFLALSRNPSSPQVQNGVVLLTLTNPTQNMIPMARNGWRKKIIEVGKPYRARVRVSGKSCYEARVFPLG